MQWFNQEATALIFKFWLEMNICDRYIRVRILKKIKFTWHTCKKTQTKMLRDRSQDPWHDFADTGTL